MTALLEAIFGETWAHAAPAALLLLARVGPLAWVAPWLGWSGLAGVLRMMVAVVLTLGLMPVALVHAPGVDPSVSTLALAVLRELVIGATFAVAVSTPLYALEWAGRMVDDWRDAESDATSGRAPLAQLYLGAGVVSFWAMGGHRLVLRGFATTLGEVPLGSASVFGVDLALGVVRLIASALELALTFAAPAALAMVVLELTRGLAARAAAAAVGRLEASSLRAVLLIAVAGIGLSALMGRVGLVYARTVELATELVGGFAGP